MADLVITAANVRKGANADIETGTAGVAVTAGQTVYKDEADASKFKLADANASLIAADSYAVALHAAAADQPLTVQKGGEITIGATVVPGAVYVQSHTPGGIKPVADLATGDFTKVIAIGKTTTVLQLVMRTAGVAVP